MKVPDKFKIGDKVECIDPVAAQEWCISDRKAHTAIGLVVKYTNNSDYPDEADSVCLDNGWYYPHTALELVKEQTYIKPSEIQAGQVWDRRDGRIGTIEVNPNSTEFIWKLIFDNGDFSTHDAYGRFGYNLFDDRDFRPKDLKGMLYDVDDEKPIPVIVPKDEILKCDPTVMMVDVEELHEAWKYLGWNENEVQELIDAVSEIRNPEYAEYLRLKEKYES